MDQLTKAQRALAKFYEISDALIAAAAQEFAPPPSKGDRCAEYATWIGRQSEGIKNAWLTELIGGSKSKLRTEILAQFRKDQPSQSWPTVQLGRTIAELQTAAEGIQQAMDTKSAATSARKRAGKLAKMAADPAPYLEKTEQLVAERTTDSYHKVSQLLADLREALADSDRVELAERQAQKLKKMNPTLRHLTAALRRQGFVPK